jgi:hypothetical protein
VYRFADFVQQGLFEVHQTRLADEVLFEVAEACVHHLFDAKNVGSEEVTVLTELLVHASFEVVNPLIEMATQVAKPTIIYQDTDQNGQGRQSGADSRDYYLSEWAHGTDR